MLGNPLCCLSGCQGSASPSRCLCPAALTKSLSESRNFLLLGAAKARILIEVVTPSLLAIADEDMPMAPSDVCCGGRGHRSSGGIPYSSNL
jgi:hypothetical protein